MIKTTSLLACVCDDVTKTLSFFQQEEDNGLSVMWDKKARC